MSKWTTYRINDIAKVIGGGTPKTNVSEYWNGDIPWITPKDLTTINTIFISRGERNITKTGLEKSSAQLLPKGTVLLTSRAPIGSVAIASNELATNQGFKSLICNEKLAYNVFIYYWLLSNKEYLNSIGTGTTFAEISGSVVKDIEISLPLLSEQKAITEVLKSLDDKIDLLHRQNKTLEAMVETLFRQWFIEEAEDDWEEVELLQFGNVICGKTPSKKVSEYFGNDIPFIKIPDMHQQVHVIYTADNLSLKGEQSQSNKTLPVGAICVSCIATVGLVALTSKPSQTNQQINSIIPKKNYYRYFLYLLMKNSYDILQSMASGGTATLNLNTGDFSRLKVIMPPLEVLTEFHNQVAPLFEKILFNQKQILLLAEYRDTLLPKLISGEVRVEY